MSPRQIDFVSQFVLNHLCRAADQRGATDRVRFPFRDRGCCHGRAVVKQSMMTTGILTATLFGGLIDVAKGGVILNGVAADQTTFLNMLNAASPIGAWTAPGNTLAFTANNAARNNFETALLTIRNEALNNVTLNGENNQGGVLVGAFHGGGTQTLDLTDIAAFSADSSTQVGFISRVKSILSL